MLIDGDNLWISKLYHIKCVHQFYGPPVIEECVYTLPGEPGEFSDE